MIETIVKLVLEVLDAVGPYAAEALGRWFDGDDGPEVTRAVEDLPSPLRSRAEVIRQRLDTERALREALGEDEHQP